MKGEFNTPEIIPILQPSVNIRHRTIAEIEEIPTIKNYYDGSLGLNKITIDCTVFTEKAACYQQTTCGWCTSFGTCVLGNANGPLGNCPADSFEFVKSNIRNLIPGGVIQQEIVPK